MALAHQLETAVAVRKYGNGSKPSLVRAVPLRLQNTYNSAILLPCFPLLFLLNLFFELRLSFFVFHLLPRMSGEAITASARVLGFSISTPRPLFCSIALRFCHLLSLL